ncbi:MAG: PqqD family protein [Desulfobacteraceae bacterium]
MKSNQVPLKKSDIRLNQKQQGAVLYNPRTEEIHLLNPVALLVWECCTGAYTMSDIVRLLETIYGPKADLSSEVQGIVQKFAEKVLLELVCRH